MIERPSPAGAAALAVLALFTVWITWRAKALESGLQSQAATPALVHKPAPDFQLAALDGRMVSAADYRGRKKLVVSFWASWCTPCRMEIPVLREFYKRAHHDDSDFEFLAISIDENPGDAEAAAAEYKLPFPVLLDPASRVAGAYQVDGIPTLFIIDRSGNISYGHIGLDPGVEYTLARELGIPNYTPVVGEPPNARSH